MQVNTAFQMTLKRALYQGIKPAFTLLVSLTFYMH